MQYPDISDLELIAEEEDSVFVEEESSARSDGVETDSGIGSANPEAAT